MSKIRSSEFKKRDDTFIEENEILSTNSYFSTFKTLIGFVVSEQKKKQRSFQIGIFTIFLVVAFLTLLKSAVDVAPVAFVKIG